MKKIMWNSNNGNAQVTPIQGTNSNYSSYCHSPTYYYGSFDQSVVSHQAIVPFTHRREAVRSLLRLVARVELA